MTLRVESIGAQAEQLARTAGELRELASGFHLAAEDADQADHAGAIELPRAA